MMVSGYDYRGVEAEIVWRFQYVLPAVEGGHRVEAVATYQVILTLGQNDTNPNSFTNLNVGCQQLLEDGGG